MEGILCVLQEPRSIYAHYAGLRCCPHAVAACPSFGQRSHRTIHLDRLEMGVGPHHTLVRCRRAAHRRARHRPMRASDAEGVAPVVLGVLGVPVGPVACGHALVA